MLNELYKLKTEYQKTLSESEDALLQSQLTDLINTTQELIDIYYTSHNTDANRNTNRFHLAICANGNDNYLTNPELYASYCNNVSAVIAYFNMKGYKLAAELLTHARSNTSPSSTYLPTYGNRVRNSSIFTAIANGTKTKGSATFPNSGTKYEKDLYYAIHKFNYTKTSASSKTVRITDTYDYVSSGDYTGVAGVAVSVMADAQRFGVITPYTVLITCKAS